MTRCELIPVSDLYGDDPHQGDEEFYCETCGEYVEQPCSDDYE